MAVSINSSLPMVRFNRNIVECKEESCKKMMQRFWVLIETLWNVKHDGVRNKSNDGYGFNRNIVECKDTRF